MGWFSLPREEKRALEAAGEELASDLRDLIEGNSPNVVLQARIRVAAWYHHGWTIVRKPKIILQIVVIDPGYSNLDVLKNFIRGEIRRARERGVLGRHLLRWEVRMGKRNVKATGGGKTPIFRTLTPRVFGSVRQRQTAAS